MIQTRESNSTQSVVRESTAGRLYDDYMNFYYDIHSGGVSLQQTKEKNPNSLAVFWEYTAGRISGKFGNNTLFPYYQFFQFPNHH